jgi:hypothetical protein
MAVTTRKSATWPIDFRCAVRSIHVVMKGNLSRGSVPGQFGAGLKGHGLSRANESYTKGPGASAPARRFALDPRAF